MKTLPAFLLVAIAIALLSPAGRPQAAAPIEEPEGEIGGTVFSAKTGEVLKGAQVTLRVPASRSRRPGRFGQKQTTSGFDGRFLFAQLPEGEYILMASKAGYETRRGFRELAASNWRETSRARIFKSACGPQRW